MKQLNLCKKSQKPYAPNLTTMLSMCVLYALIPEQTTRRLRMSDPYVFNCTVVRVIDGDTVDVDVDLGFGCWVRGNNGRIRLFGIDAPESRGGTVETKSHGLLAKKFVQDFLKVGTTCTLRTLDKGKFGRYLGDFKVYDKWLCKELVDNFLAVPYSGQSKDTIAMLHEANRQTKYK